MCHPIMVSYHGLLSWAPIMKLLCTRLATADSQRVFSEDAKEFRQVLKKILSEIHDFRLHLVFAYIRRAFTLICFCLEKFKRIKAHLRRMLDESFPGQNWRQTKSLNFRL